MFLQTEEQLFIEQLFIEHKKCSRATLRFLAGRIWPTGRTLSRSDLEYLHAILCQNGHSFLIFKNTKLL
jgi:hypothetical protein